MTFYISPYRRLSTLRQAMDRLFEDTLAENTPTEREMLLAVDVVADDEAYTIKALVPGIKSEDLNIETINNTVTIRGEFKGLEDEQGNCLVSELPQGTFSRVLTLPTPIDASKAEANIKDGILILRVPKAEAHRPKSIKISSN